MAIATLLRLDCDVLDMVPPGRSGARGEVDQVMSPNAGTMSMSMSHVIMSCVKPSYPAQLRSGSEERLTGQPQP